MVTARAKAPAHPCVRNNLLTMSPECTLSLAVADGSPENRSPFVDKKRRTAMCLLFFFTKFATYQKRDSPKK